MEQRTLIVALHGFLGQPQDWASYLKKIKKPNDQLVIPFLFEDSPWSPQKTLPEWNKYFKTQCDAWLSEGFELKLMAYSLGGRLVLKTYLDYPDYFKEAHFFSVNPGLIDLAELEARRKSDLNWAQRFRHDSWEALIKDWNQQAVFKNDFEPIRHEKDFSRDLLALGLTHWSLAEQENFWPKLILAKKPIYWWVGENDIKFLDIARKLQAKNPNITVNCIPQCGHRSIFKMV
jgi:2-succinyl-6-hydroxy-2,4-cyclohexadiene-1-carboxylate synthase